MRTRSDRISIPGDASRFVFFFARTHGVFGWASAGDWGGTKCAAMSMLFCAGGVTFDDNDHGFGNMQLSPFTHETVVRALVRELAEKRRFIALARSEPDARRAELMAGLTRMRGFHVVQQRAFNELARCGRPGAERLVAILRDPERRLDYGETLFALKKSGSTLIETAVVELLHRDVLWWQRATPPETAEERAEESTMRESLFWCAHQAAALGLRSAVNDLTEIERACKRSPAFADVREVVNEALRQLTSAPKK